MRTSLIAMILVFALALTALAVGGGSLLEWQEEIAITEETLLGHVSAAEGLQITTRANYNEQLFWETSYMARKSPQPETDFTYYNERQASPRIQIGNVIMSSDSISFGISGTGLELSAHKENLMIKPVEDVESRTGAGETRTETVFLKDYYDYYPVRLDVELDSYSYFDGTAKRVEYKTGPVDVSDIFRFPIQDSMRVTVEVTKNSAGQLKQVKSDAAGPVYNYGFYNEGIIMEDAAYVAITNYGEEALDFSQVLLGYGLYRIPLEAEDRGSYICVEGRYKEIENVWPVNYPDAVILGVDKSADDSRIYLTVQEADGTYLTVLRTEDHTQLARLSLGHISTPEIRLEKGLLVVTGYDQKLEQHRIVAFHGENWEKWLDAELPVDEDCDMQQPVMAFDGERLAVACFMTYTGMSLRLLIYQNNDMQYMGNSMVLSTRGPWWIRTNEKDSLTLTWK